MNYYLYISQYNSSKNIAGNKDILTEWNRSYANFPSNVLLHIQDYLDFQNFFYFDSGTNSNNIW